MLPRLFFTVIFGLTVMSPTSLFASSEKLSIFKCDSALATEYCDRGCSLESGEYDFLVNKAQKSVMQRHYLKNSSPTSQVFNNCKIFDERNWDCSEKPTWTGKWYVYQIHKMTDGVYIYQFYTSDSGNIPKTKVDPNGLGICAKR